ncbi:kinase-like protein [Ascodesmis nigricans]|uniref:Kinase-like protein n=1 Tax=Ascodesmis nigricans TaxID=341454 RepID=A0A4V3SJL2_9PEZI|nr:kinase-like protein [Ascodesmis nigricans]
MGHVRSEREQKTGRMGAVKTVWKRKVREQDWKRELLAMGILSKYNHAFVRFLGWYEDANTLFLTMGLFEFGDLSKYLAVNHHRPESETKIMGLQIFRALEFMHFHNFTHRDLKPDNIFIASTQPLHLKLGDFGITKRTDAGTELRTMTFTALYAAPEALERFIYPPHPPQTPNEAVAYTSKVDIWSAGCVLYHVLTRNTPFNHPHHALQFCKRNDPGAQAVVDRPFLLRPEDRPTAKEAREMQWVKDWDQRDVETETEGTTWATMSRRELEAELTKLKDKVKRAETEVMRLQQASTIMIESKEKEHRQAQQALEAKINELRLLMSQIRLSLNPKQEEDYRKALESERAATAPAEQAADIYQKRMTAAQKSAMEARESLMVAIKSHESELAQKEAEFNDRLRTGVIQQITLKNQLDHATEAIYKANKENERPRENLARLETERPACTSENGNTTNSARLLEKGRLKTRELQRRMKETDEKLTAFAAENYRLNLKLSRAAPEIKADVGVPSQSRARALYAYTGTEPQDLMFPQGALIMGGYFPRWRMVERLV